MERFFRFLLALADVLCVLALLIVSYYGIKYVFVAGPIFFGTPAGYVAAGLVTFFFALPFALGVVEWIRSVIRWR